MPGKENSAARTVLTDANKASLCSLGIERDPFPGKAQGPSAWRGSPVGWRPGNYLPLLPMRKLRPGEGKPLTQDFPAKPPFGDRSQTQTQASNLSLRAS